MLYIVMLGVVYLAIVLADDLFWKDNQNADHQNKFVEFVAPFPASFRHELTSTPEQQQTSRDLTPALHGARDHRQVHAGPHA